MSEDTTTITRDRAITLINDPIENFATYYDSYCCDNRDSLSDEERELYQEMSEVTGILRNDADYANDLKIMPLEHLTQFLYMCKEMVENNDLFTKYSYPKGNILIVENEHSNPELIEKALESLEQHGDERIKNAIKEYHAGDRPIRFSKMPENQNGLTYRIDDRYSHFVTENLMQDTPENQIQVAITLAHEFKRNAATDSIEGETREIVLEDTKIIESFANTYGEEIYQKFPEYGILHYIKKIFGETELQGFADFAFDSTGNYWKVNSAGDLIDDGNTTKVFDKDGNEQELNFNSEHTGRQGTLEKWLGVDNAFLSLMRPAGYVWNDKDGKWAVKPEQIKFDKIEEAHSTGKITDAQFNMIKIAAGLLSKNDDAESEKENIFMKFLKEFYDKNIKNNFINIAIKWLNNKIQESKNNKNNIVNTPETNLETTCLKQRPLEEKYGYPYTAPSFGSLCLATSIINLYILDENLSEENVEKFMNEAKGKFIASDGKVISFEKMSRKLSELSGDEKYFDYVYYNPETKTYSANKKAMSKEDFIKSDYEYGIGAYIHLDEDPNDENITIAHYELIKRTPFMEYNPGISEYQLFEIYPVSKYKR